MDDRFLQFSIAVSKLNKQLQKLKSEGMRQFDLKGAHTLCLYQLLEHPDGMLFSQLSASCDLDQALVSRTLAALARQGLVERSGPPGTYSARYALTPLGRDTAAEVAAIVARVQALADDGISQEDLAVFYRVLYQLLENFERAVENAGELLSGPSPQQERNTL